MLTLRGYLVVSRDHDAWHHVGFLHQGTLASARKLTQLSTLQHPFCPKIPRQSTWFRLHLSFYTSPHVPLGCGELVIEPTKPISLTRRHALWALLLAKSLSPNRCCLCSASFLCLSTPGFDFAALVEWSFLTSHPMFPLWVVQLLPTSPDLPL